MAFKKILVPMDGSERSIKAAGVALDLASNDGAELFLLHSIYFVAKVAAAKNDSSVSIVDKSSDDIRIWFEKIFRMAKSRKIVSHDHVSLSDKSVSYQIVEYAKEQGIDLIVMGSMGSNISRKPLLGSTAYGVISKAPCSVMIVS